MVDNLHQRFQRFQAQGPEPIPAQRGSAATTGPLPVGQPPPLAKSADRLYLLDPPESAPQFDPHPRGEHPDGHPLPLVTPAHVFERQAVNRISDPHSLSVTFRHSGWRHNRELIAAALSRTEQPFSRCTNFANCGSDAYILRSLDNPNVYRLAGSSCHDRFCLPCAQERSNAIALNVLDLTAGKQTRFLTLTLKATNDPLSLQLDKLYQSFAKLRRRKLWIDKVTGGVAFLEITWSDANQTWHPHFHILIEGTYIHQRSLAKLWYAITGDSFVVDIRFVRDLPTASRYVTKYASKPFNNTFLNRPAPLDEAILAFKGRKLLITFGSWRNITLIATPTEGAWEHVAPLETVITNAAHGDTEAQAILRALTDTDLAPLFARAPPRPPPPPIPPPDLTQLTFFAVWQRNGTYIYPGKHHFIQDPQDLAGIHHSVLLPRPTPPTNPVSTGNHPSTST